MRNWVVKVMLTPTEAGWRTDCERLQQAIRCGSVIPYEGGQSIGVYTQTKAESPGGAVTAICDLLWGSGASEPQNMVAGEAALARL